MSLTTTQALFIEEAKQAVRAYIHQPYHLYSEENQEAWRQLFARQRRQWDRYANQFFQEGLARLWLTPDRIPALEEVSHYLDPLTGFNAQAVSGYVPTDLFMAGIARREFPTTITIRGLDRLDYLPEPDIFHDLAGHVPMHTSTVFAEALVAYGRLATVAADYVQTLPLERQQDVAQALLTALSRVFWFTVEFGLVMSRKD